MATLKVVGWTVVADPDREELTYWGHIVDIQKTEKGWAVGIDLKDEGNCTFYLFQQQPPDGNYLEYYVKFNSPIPKSRVVISKRP